LFLLVDKKNERESKYLPTFLFFSLFNDEAFQLFPRACSLGHCFGGTSPRFGGIDNSSDPPLRCLRGAARFFLFSFAIVSFLLLQSPLRTLARLTRRRSRRFFFFFFVRPLAQRDQRRFVERDGARSLGGVGRLRARLLRCRRPCCGWRRRRRKGFHISFSLPFPFLDVPLPFFRPALQRNTLAVDGGDQIAVCGRGRAERGGKRERQEWAFVAVVVVGGGGSGGERCPRCRRDRSARGLAGRPRGARCRVRNEGGGGTNERTTTNKEREKGAAFV